MIKYLQILECNEYSSIEDIKKSFRRLSLKYHPDISKESSDKFIRLKIAYDYLLINHVPIKQQNKFPSSQSYFRVLKDDVLYHSINVPYDNFINENITIYCMFGFIEFRINLEKGARLPMKLMITNLPIKTNIYVTINSGYIIY